MSYCEAGYGPGPGRPLNAQHCNLREDENLLWFSSGTQASGHVLLKMQGRHFYHVYLQDWYEGGSRQNKKTKQNKTKKVEEQNARRLKPYQKIPQETGTEGE